MRKGLAGTALAAIALFAAGCSDEEPNGDPLPPGNTTTAASASVPANDPAAGPKVANPVTNLEKFKQAPCDMMSKSQAAELTFDTKIAKVTDADFGPECEWENKAGDFISIVLHNKQPLGISGIYRNHDQFPEIDAYFEPMDIAGFPGVLADSVDRRPNGACALSVGVTDQQVIVLTNRVDTAAGIDPCDLLKRAAEAAVTTMSKG